MPVRVDCKMMVYNKALFEQYGVQVPTTWDEFLAVCQTFKDARSDTSGAGESGPVGKLPLYFHLQRNVRAPGYPGKGLQLQDR